MGAKQYTRLGGLAPTLARRCPVVKSSRPQPEGNTKRRLNRACRCADSLLTRGPRRCHRRRREGSGMLHLTDSGRQTEGIRRDTSPRLARVGRPSATALNSVPDRVELNRLNSVRNRVAVLATRSRGLHGFRLLVSRGTIDATNGVLRGPALIAWRSTRFGTESQGFARRLQLLPTTRHARLIAL